MRLSIRVTASAVLLASTAACQYQNRELEQRRGLIEYAQCGKGTTQIRQAIAAPPNASVLRALADAAPTFPSLSASYKSEVWLATDGGTITLCRSEVAPRISCYGEWWTFESSERGWQIVSRDGWTCVTSTAPHNKSFERTREG
jgi:hypothetical protein